MMEVQAAPRAYPLNRVRPNWPGTAGPRDQSNDTAIARQFESLIVASLLRSARAAKLGDDGLGDTGDSVRDMQDRQRAEAIAAAAPLGVARLLAAERAKGAPQ